MTRAIAVYPCVYREHPIDRVKNGEITGLSLCIQGTRINRERFGNILRFIPVYTGNTLGAAIPNLNFAVYPCVYREHSNYNILFYN